MRFAIEKEQEIPRLFFQELRNDLGDGRHFLVILLSFSFWFFSSVYFLFLFFIAGVPILRFQSKMFSHPTLTKAVINRVTCHPFYFLWREKIHK